MKRSALALLLGLGLSSAVFAQDGAAPTVPSSMATRYPNVANSRGTDSGAGVACEYVADYGAAQAPGQAPLPYGGTYKGPDQVEACLRRAFSAWGNVAFTLDRMLVGRDLGFVLFDVRFTAKCGHIVEIPVVELWRIRNAKLIEIRPFYFDTHAVWDALADHDRS